MVASIWKYLHVGSSGQSVVVAINKRLCHICDRTPSAYKQVIFKHNTFARERQRSLRLAYLDDVSLVVANSGLILYAGLEHDHI